MFVKGLKGLLFGAAAWRLMRSAWTSPTTWTSTLVTVAQFNAQIRDNLNALKSPPSGITNYHGADVSVSSTSFANVDSNLAQSSLAIAGTEVLVGFSGTCRPSADTERRLYFNVSVDGTDYFSDDGFLACGNGAITNSSAMLFPVCFVAWLTVTPGTRTFRLRAKVNAGSYTIYGFTTSNYATYSSFWAREVS